MANGRNKHSKGDAGRDAGGFVALPWAVMDCAAYARLSHPAKALLLELARQFVRDNNGRLLASGAYLAKRGWHSSDVITRAKRELINAGLIFETVKGHRPNRASWYAVTWRALDKISGFDVGAAVCFERGAYQKGALPQKLLTPSPGVARASIAPSPGVERHPPTPSPGAIKALFSPTPTPSPGDHLEMPSIAVGGGLLLATAQATATKAQMPIDEPDLVGGQPDRVHDHDLDPKWFDPITGEFCLPAPAPVRHQKLGANRWVESALAVIPKGDI